MVEQKIWKDLIFIQWDIQMHVMTLILLHSSLQLQNFCHLEAI